MVFSGYVSAISPFHSFLWFHLSVRIEILINSFICQDIQLLASYNTGHAVFKFDKATISHWIVQADSTYALETSLFGYPLHGLRRATSLSPDTPKLYCSVGSHYSQCSPISFKGSHC